VGRAWAGGWREYRVVGGSLGKYEQERRDVRVWRKQRVHCCMHPMLLGKEMPSGPRGVLLGRGEEKGGKTRGGLRAGALLGTLGCAARGSWASGRAQRPRSTRRMWGGGWRRRHVGGVADRPRKGGQATIRKMKGKEWWDFFSFMFLFFSFSIYFLPFLFRFGFSFEFKIYHAL
jgi:hypothetical protein